MLQYFFILTCLLICLRTKNLLALDPVEKLQNVKILQVLERNVIIINRGLEDGILKDDHAKLTHSKMGFVSRLICIKSYQQKSMWKVYRVTRSEKISLDYNYQLHGMADREIPPHLKELRFHPEKKYVYEIPSQKKSSQQIIPDLTKKIHKGEGIYQESEESSSFNKEQLKREISHHQISFFISPYIKQSKNSSQNLRFGFSSRNFGKKYIIHSHFDQLIMKQKDLVTGQSTISQSSFGNLSFSIKNHVHFSSLIQFRSQYFSSLGTPVSHWQIAPLGFVFNLVEKEDQPIFQVSYFPLLDIRTHETQDQINSSQKNRSQVSGLRHGFRLFFTNSLSERVDVKNTLWYRPYHDLSKGDVLFNDMNLKNDFIISFKLGRNLFFDYHLIYQVDEQWRTLNSFSKENVINSFNIRLKFHF